MHQNFILTSLLLIRHFSHKHATFFFFFNVIRKSTLAAGFQESIIYLLLFHSYSSTSTFFFSCVESILMIWTCCFLGMHIPFIKIVLLSVQALFSKRQRNMHGNFF